MNMKKIGLCDMVFATKIFFLSGIFTAIVIVSGDEGKIILHHIVVDRKDYDIALYTYKNCN